MRIKRWGTGRSRTALVVAALLALVTVAAACAPPTTPSGTVLPQPPGRGKVPGAGVVASAGCAAGVVDPLPAGRSTVTVIWQNRHRTALVDVPATGTGPRPLLISLHPFSVANLPWDDYSGLAAAGTARDHVVVTPQGSDPGPRWAVPGGLDTGIDDVGFVNQLMNVIEDRTCIDRNREFAAGFSAGAAMAQALGCTIPWRMAAVAGSGGTNLTDLCPSSPAVDTMVLHGEDDPIAPLTGSEVPFATPNGLAVDSVVATNAARAGCDPTPVADQRYPTVQVDTYTGCDGALRLEYWRMADTGHTWAGVPSLIDIVAGPTNTDFSATEAVLDFFEAHTDGVPI